MKNINDRYLKLAHYNIYFCQNINIRVEKKIPKMESQNKKNYFLYFYSYKFSYAS